MNKKTKGIVAGVAGGVLLLGAGGTFALWSDSEIVGGHVIQAGTLDVHLDTPSWFDVSPDRANATADIQFERSHVEALFEGAQFGTTITGARVAEGWHIVPGDYFVGQAERFWTSVVGDNLKYELTIASSDADLSTEFAQALDLRFTFVDHDGNNVSFRNRGDGTWVPASGASGSTNVLPVGSVIHFEDAGPTSDRPWTIQVGGAFSRDTQGQKFVGETVDVTDLAITITQLR